MAAHTHVRPISQWKKVKIDPKLLTNNEFKDLICMEELTNYKLFNPNKGKKSEKGATSKQKEIVKKKQGKKTPVTSHLETSSKNGIDSTEAIIMENTKKKKKRKKKSEKRKIGKIVDKIKDDIVDIATEVMVDTEVKKTKAQKRKRKSQDKDGNTDEKPKKRKKSKSHVPEEDKETEKPPEDRIKPEEISSNMKAWEKMFVPKSVLQALHESRFYHPTPIQTLTLPHAIRDRLDIVGAAETGSGKTLAFGIPVIHNILQYRENEFLQNTESDEENEVSLEDHIDNENQSDIAEDDDADDCDNMDDNEDDDSSNDDDNNNESDVEVDDKDEIEEEMLGLQDLNEDGLGCVRVIDDADFSKLGIDLPTLEEPAHFPLALILEPTRELAIQVKNHLQAATRFCDIKIATILGGMSAEKQKRILKKCPEIIVATPGRLWELIEKGEVYVSEITKVRSLVIDEADRMIEKGHFEELTKLLGHIYRNEENRKKRQTFVFSATLTMVHSGPNRPTQSKQKLTQERKLALLMKRIKLKEKPKVIDLTRKVGTVETLTEARINCTVEEKDVYLYYFLKQYPGRTLVFTNSKDCIRRLVSIFTLLQTNPLSLHADMHQKQRLKNLERFTAGGNSLLLASDVAARGLDIPNVQHVIHYQVPLTVENYVHRSGRTARAMKEGLSIMLVGPDDVKNYRKIIHTLNRSEDLPLFPVEHNILPALKRRIGLARQIDVTEHRFNKKKRQNQWFQKAADDMDMLLDDDDLLNDLGDSREQAIHKQQIKILKSELNSLLHQQLISSDFSGKYPTSSGRLHVPAQPDTKTSAVCAVKMDKKTQEKLSKSMKFSVKSHKSKKWKNKKKPKMKK